jgi:hypothetical protein
MRQGFKGLETPFPIGLIWTARRWPRGFKACVTGSRIVEVLLPATKPSEGMALGSNVLLWMPLGLQGISDRLNM